MLTYDSDWIIEHIHDVKAFAKDMARAAAHGIETGSFSRLRDCLLDWQATAEINAIPGMRDNVVAGHKAIEEDADEDLPTWEEFLKDVGVTHG